MHITKCMVNTTYLISQYWKFASITFRCESVHPCRNFVIIIQNDFNFQNYSSLKRWFYLLLTDFVLLNGKKFKVCYPISSSFTKTLEKNEEKLKINFIAPLSMEKMDFLFHQRRNMKVTRDFFTRLVFFFSLLPSHIW